MTAAKLGWAPRFGALAFGLALLLGTTARAQEEKKAVATEESKKIDPDREALLKLNTVTGKEAQQTKLVAFVKDKDKAKKNVALAVKMRKEAKGKDEKPFNATANLMLGRAAAYLKEYDAAETFLDDALEAATKVSNGAQMLQAFDGLMDLYWDTKKYSAVVETCEKALDVRGVKEVENAQVFVLEQLVKAKSKLGQFDDALKVTKTLIEAADEKGSGWYFLRLKAFVEHEAGKNDAAIKTHLEVIEKLDAAKMLEADIRDQMKDSSRYLLSGLYVDAKDIDKAAEQLQILIKRHPDRATYKNDLGFIWCDHDIKLEESEKLIRDALVLDKKEREKLKGEGKLDEVKENAAYLDSLGWVLFKQKKYKEALEYLKKACADDDDGNHLEIWDHLADCHMAMDQKKEAIAAWEKGLTMEDISKRDAERRRKVTEKLKKARADK